MRPGDGHIDWPASCVDELLISGRGGVHHIWGCDHFKTTLSADRFRQVYKRVPYGDRAALVEAVMSAIARAGRSARTSTSCRP